MRQPLAYVGMVTIWVGLAIGCDNGGDPGSESGDTDSTLPPSGRKARAFMKAVQYRDVEGAFEHHLESTREGIYCRSESFREILERTDDAKTDRDCDDVDEIGPERRAALEADAELLVQVLRFVCEQPEGTCVDYAERVFETQIPRTELWKRARHFDIRNVERDGDTARVYVDYWRDDEKDVDGRRTLNLEHYRGEWYVTDPFGSSQPKRPR